MIQTNDIIILFFRVLYTTGALFKLKVVVGFKIKNNYHKTMSKTGFMIFVLD